MLFSTAPVTRGDRSLDAVDGKYGATISSPLVAPTCWRPSRSGTQTSHVRQGVHQRKLKWEEDEKEEESLQRPEVHQRLPKVIHSIQPAGVLSPRVSTNRLTLTSSSVPVGFRRCTEGHLRLPKVIHSIQPAESSFSKGGHKWHLFLRPAENQVSPRVLQLAPSG